MKRVLNKPTNIGKCKKQKVLKSDLLFDLSLIPTVEYYPNFLGKETPSFDNVMNWLQDHFKFYTWSMMGKSGFKNRQECFISLDHENKIESYKYGSTEYKAVKICDIDIDCKNFIDVLWLKLSSTLGLDVTNPPNGIFCNLYDKKTHKIPFHSDNEPSMDVTKPIISVSFGGSREFKFCPRYKSTKCIAKILLKHGGVAIMNPGTQEKYRHGITKGSSDKRINLTFRWFL